MRITPLSSLQNVKIKEALSLRERRARDQSGLFLIEGYRELLRALEADWLLVRLFMCEPLFLGENEQALIKRAAQAGAEIISCDPKLFQRLSYRDRPDGLLGVSMQRHWGLDKLTPLVKKRASPLLVVAEAIEKPGNLGTILRSSDAVGVDGLILCDQCTDLHNPNVIRASVGTRFTVPAFEAEGAAAISWLRQQKIKIVATTPAADTLFTAADLTAPVAIVVGTEQLGLSAAWLEAADLRVRIPMKGAADSLNVAMATTLVLYEALRQRTGSLN